MKVLTKRYERWGIDVDVEFEDNDSMTRMVTMQFKTDKQIESDLQTQVDLLVARIAAEKLERQNTVLEDVLVKKIDSVLIEKGTLTKTEYDALVEESKVSVVSPIRVARVAEVEIA